MTPEEEETLRIFNELNRLLGHAIAAITHEMLRKNWNEMDRRLMAISYYKSKMIGSFQLSNN